MNDTVATSRPAPAEARLLFILLCAAVFAMNLQPLRCMDYWHHTAAGRLVVERGRPAETDVFSHTAEGKRWIQYEWLAQLLLYLGHRALGVTPLILIKAVIAAMAFLLVAAACTARGVRSAAAVAVAGEIALVASLRSYLRPEIITLVIFAGFVFVAERERTSASAVERRKGVRLLWLLPALMVIWVNAHGAWIAGLVYLGCVASGESVKRLLAGRLKMASAPSRATATRLWTTLAACSLATLANPYGYRIWAVPLGLTRSRVIGHVIAEWQPIRLSYLASDPHFWMLHVLFLCLLLTLRRIDLTDLGLLILFGGLAFTARRHLWLFCLICAPLLARHLGLASDGARHFLGALSNWSRRRSPPAKTTSRTRVPKAAAPGLAGVLVLLMTWCALGIPGLDKFGVGIEREKFPINAADFLEDHDLAGNLFNTYGFGNYLLWRLYPRNLVFVDGRVDVYGDAIVREYDRLRLGKPHWDEQLRSRSVRVAVLRSKPHAQATDEALLTCLFSHPAWRLVFWDERAAVFVRDPRENLARLADGTEFRFLTENFSSSRVRSRKELEEVTRYLEKKLGALESTTRTDADPAKLASVHANLGLCYQEYGDFDQAAEQFRRLVALKPNDDCAHALLGESLYLMAQKSGLTPILFAEAEEAFLRAIRLGEAPKKALHNLGNLYYLAGRYRGAIKMHSRAFRLAPSDWRLPWSMSFSCEKLGDISAARAHLRTVLKLSPEHRQARQRLLEMPNDE